MKLAIAQIQSSKGNIEENIAIHKRMIAHAVAAGTDFIAFPELSLTAYEPSMAEALAIDENDMLLDDFQSICNNNKITIAMGAPIKSELGIHIGMIIFEPYSKRMVYLKQHLAKSEKSYFKEGSVQKLVNVCDKNLAPAICYESFLEDHLISAKNLGGEFYLSSTANDQAGIEKAYSYFPDMAKKYQVAILMCNSIGYYDNFLSAGQSAIWDHNGRFMGKLEADKEGILLLDTDTNKVVTLGSGLTT